MLSGSGEKGQRPDSVPPRCSLSRTKSASWSSSSSRAGVRSASGGFRAGLVRIWCCDVGSVGGGGGESWMNRLMVEWYPTDLFQLLSLKCQQFAIKSDQCKADRKRSQMPPGCFTSFWIYCQLEKNRASRVMDGGHGGRGLVWQDSTLAPKAPEWLDKIENVDFKPTYWA